MTNRTEESTQTTLAPVENSSKSMKLAIMYVLIGGLVLSALISVAAILIGEFNEIIQKTLFTTFIVVTHTLILLGFISNDKQALLGRSLVPTTIFGVILANIVTSTLGTWGVWDSDISWRAFSLYALLIGTAFIAAGLLRARIAHPGVTAAAYTSLGLLGLWTLLLVPWIFIDVSMLDEFYFRLVGAASILLATAVAVTIVLRQIIISQKPELKAVSTEPHLNAGMLAVIITVGVIVGIMWFVGFFAFLVSAAQATL
jgi:hypothetical protein